MEQGPPLHLGVAAIEKEAFGSSSTKVANFTYLEGKIIKKEGYSKGRRLRRNETKFEY